MRAAEIVASDARDGDAIEVRGDRRDLSRAPKDPTVAGAVVERADLASPGVRIGEVLRAQAGVQTTELGGAGAPVTASIRGATAAETPVYLGGIRMNDEVGGAADLSRIPLWIVQRIEIYRGHAPFEADRLGIGGAIFFEPRRARESSAGGGATIGSWGSRGAFAWGTVGDARAGVLVGVQIDHADNDYPFVNRHGTLLASTGSEVDTLSNVDVTTRDAWMIAREEIGAATVDAILNVSSRDQGVPTLALLPSTEARATYARAIGGVHARLAVTRDVKLDVSSSGAWGTTEYDDPLRELGLAATKIAYMGLRAQERVAIDVGEEGPLRVRGALDASSERLDRDDDDAPAVRAQRLFFRASAAATWRLTEALSVNALGAMACDGTTDSGSGCASLAPEGRVGVAWSERDFDLFVDGGHYRRAPTLGELFGMAPLVHGNPMLVPETGNVIDAGVRLHVSQAFASASAFARQASDLVGFVRSSGGYVEPENIEDARVMGVELQAGAWVCPWLSVDGSATILDPRNTSPNRTIVNDILPFQSMLVVAPRVAVETKHPGLSWLARLRAEVRWLHQSSRYADNAGLAVLPAQDTVDAEVLVEGLKSRWIVRVRVADLFDSPHFDVVGFPLPGRSLFTSLEVHS